MKKKYYDEIAEVMHKETVAQYKMGHVSEEDMREMDDLCLVKEGESPEEEMLETEEDDLTEVPQEA